MNQLSQGIIPKFPEIKINLFADNLKDVEYVLLNSELSYDFKEVKMNTKEGKRSIKSIPTIYLDNLSIPTEVKVYFENILQAFPTVEDLAACSYEDFFPYYKGLGYYSRARNMLATAKKVVEDFGGIFPESTQELMTLK